MTYDDPAVVLDTFSVGKMVIIICENKEKEGDFFILGEATTAETINFLLSESRGMICVACHQDITDRLQLPVMIEKPQDNFGTNFTVSVDAAVGIDTGVSATDRAATIKVLADPGASGQDLVRPGHTHPLLARDPQLRWGHTECSVTMALACGKYPVVTICEILNKSGEKATPEELFQMAKNLDCPISSLEVMKPFLSEQTGLL